MRTVCGGRLYKGNKYKDGFLLKGVPFKSMDMEEIAPNLNEMQVHTMPRGIFHAIHQCNIARVGGDRAAAQRCGSINATDTAHSQRMQARQQPCGSRFPCETNPA